MRRNIVLCCDGTANEFAKNNTNVVKLYSVLEQDPTRQVTYYHPGIGTMEPAGALTTFSRRVTKLLGMAIGYGLADDVRDAYAFIMQNYQPGDWLYLFGFSRGAYTVRAVSALLRMYGLLRPGNEPLIPYATRMLMGVNRASERKRDKSETSAFFELAKDFKATLSRECKPHFVGVWDTVSSVGWIENPLKLPYVSNNPDISIGRHAIAIDEKRAFFRTHLWIPPKDPAAPRGPQDSKQVWFAGVHCDVGGGYAEQESGLSKIALDWMLQEAKAVGLLVVSDKEQAVLGESDSRYTKPDPKGMAHESLKGAWNLAEFVPKRHYDWKKEKWTRRMNLYRSRTVPAGSMVHESVYQRGDDYSKRLPPDAIRVNTLPR